MKVTPWNIAKFWYLLMFPPSSDHHLKDRLSLKGDPPWEPWLHCAVWLSVFGVIATHWAGGISLDVLDRIWVSLGLFAPPVGFASVWILSNINSGGRARYVAMWMRLCADAGLALTIGVYSFSRIGELPHFHPIMANVVLGFSAWYMLTLVARDLRLVCAVEKLAKSLYRDDGADVVAWKLVNILGEREEGGRR